MSWLSDFLKLDIDLKDRLPSQAVKNAIPDYDIGRILSGDWRSGEQIARDNSQYDFNYLNKLYKQYNLRPATQEEYDKYWAPKANEGSKWESYIKASAEAPSQKWGTYVEPGNLPSPTSEAGSQSDLGEVFANWNIPYMGENLEKLPTIEKTETQKWVGDMLAKRATGEGVATVEGQLNDPAKMSAYSQTIDQIMAPKYQKAVIDLNERWHAAGRSFDTAKLQDIGNLSIQYGSERASQILGMAKNDVDAINMEVGRALSAGLTLSEMESRQQEMRADQQFQVNIYKRKVRDEAIQGLQDEKLKDIYTRLSRAWDNEDWTAYVALANELVEAGKPTVADYILSLVPTIANVGLAAVGKLPVIPSGK